MRELGAENGNYYFGKIIAVVVPCKKVCLRNYYYRAPTAKQM